MGALQEILSWLKKDVPPQAWQQAKLVADIESHIQNRLQRIAPQETLNEALPGLVEALQWAYIRQEVITRMAGEQRAMAFRLEEALQPILVQWNHLPPEDRAKKLYQAFTLPTWWTFSEELPAPPEERLANLSTQLEKLVHHVVTSQNRKQSIPLGWVLGILLNVLVIGFAFGGGFWIGRYQVSPKGTPTPLPSVATPTAIRLKSPTPTSGFAPTSTQAIPTPTPTSQYQHVPLLWAIPPLPNENRDVLFLIDDERAQLMPQKGWGISEGGVAHRHRYWNQSPSQATPTPVWVRWTLDVPLPYDGLYEFYVLDPVQQGGAQKAQLIYQVLVDEQATAPVAGLPFIRQWTYNEQKQEGDVWRSFGIYSLRKGSHVAVHLDLTHFLGNHNQIAGIDAVLITYLRFPTPQQCPLWFQIQKQTGVPLYWKDGASAEREPDKPEHWQALPPQALLGCGQAWLSDQPNAKVSWTFPYVIPGTYRLCAWVPVPNEEVYKGVLQWYIQVKPTQSAQWTFDNHLPKPQASGTISLSVHEFNHLVCLGTLQVNEEAALRVTVQAITPPLLANAVFLTISVP